MQSSTIIPTPAERLVDKNVFTQLFYENQFSQRIKLKAAAKWNYSWSRYSDVPASGYKEDIYRQQEAYLTVTLWSEPLQGLHLSLAQDYAHNHLSMSLHRLQTLHVTLCGQHWQQTIA